MAKRKLSVQQRTALRKDLEQLLRADKRQVDILRAMAEKYSISAITVRWYLKSLKRPKAAKAKRRKGAAGRNGIGMRLISTVQAAADRTFAKVLEVKKLIPRWQKYVKKEHSFRKAESKLRKQLLAISKKAKALHRRIESLTS